MKVVSNRRGTEEQVTGKLQEPSRCKKESDVAKCSREPATQSLTKGG